MFRKDLTSWPTMLHFFSFRTVHQLRWWKTIDFYVISIFILFIGTITTLWQVNKLSVNLDTFTVGSDKMKICLRFIITATISHLHFTLIYINLYIYIFLLVLSWPRKCWKLLYRYRNLLLIFLYVHNEENTFILPEFRTKATIKTASLFGELREQGFMAHTFLF